MMTLRIEINSHEIKRIDISRLAPMETEKEAVDGRFIYGCTMYDFQGRSVKDLTVVHAEKDGDLALIQKVTQELANLSEIRNK